MLAMVLLMITAIWNGVSAKLSRDSVKTYDRIALFVFIGVFVVIQLAFYLVITRQVITDRYALQSLVLVSIRF